MNRERNREKERESNIKSSRTRKTHTHTHQTHTHIYTHTHAYTHTHTHTHTLPLCVSVTFATQSAFHAERRICAKRSLPATVAASPVKWRLRPLRHTHITHTRTHTREHTVCGIGHILSTELSPRLRRRRAMGEKERLTTDS